MAGSESMNLRIAGVNLLLPVRRQVSYADFNHQANTAVPARVPVRICHPSCHGAPLERNQTWGQCAPHTYRTRQGGQPSPKVSDASQSDRVVSQEHHPDRKPENRVRNTPLSAFTRAPKRRSVQSSKGPALAYARERNSAIKSGISKAKRFTHDIVFFEIRPLHRQASVLYAMCEGGRLKFLRSRSRTSRQRIGLQSKRCRAPQPPALQPQCVQRDQNGRAGIRQNCHP